MNKTQSVNGQASATLTHNNDYQYTIDKPHAVTKAGNMLYTYDTNGNMLTRENTKTKAKMTLVWDNENRLKQSIGSSYTTDYRYDANGERILKSSDMGELEYVSASYVVRNGTIVSKHVFAGNGRVASTVGYLTDEGKTTTNSVLYYHPDHLGSSSYVTDKQGRFYEAIEYLPYGETLYNERTENDGVSYKYTGKEEDAETGLYYYGARYYDAKLCRWISVDPILEKYLGGKPNGGVYHSINLNLLSYSVNNPIGYSDPTGLAPEPSNKEKAIASITDHGGDNYSFTLGGVKFNMDAASWGNAKRNGKTFSQMMDRVDGKTFDFLAAMASDTGLNLESVDLNCLWRPGSGSHVEGLGIDIGSITSKSGEVINYSTDSYNAANLTNASSLRNKVANWARTHGATMVWDPYKRDSSDNLWKNHVNTYGGELLTFDVNNGGGQSSFDTFMTTRKGMYRKSDRNRIWQDVTHRHHLHITVGN